MSQTLTKRKILVGGATGKQGNAVVSLLLERGHDVVFATLHAQYPRVKRHIFRQWAQTLDWKKLLLSSSACRREEQEKGKEHACSHFPWTV